MLTNSFRTPRRISDDLLIGQEHASHAEKLLRICPAHKQTALKRCAILATELGVGSIHIKVEGERMGLGSFKALGGAYAVAQILLARSGLGTTAKPTELLSASVRAIAGELSFICASAGNHGLSVAAGARVFGSRATIVLSTSVPTSFEMRLLEQDAKVVRYGKSYEDSMTYATAEAEEQGSILISDSSWPGYTAVPLEVMRGYTVLFAEAADALDRDAEPATHVFVQAGVGGLAAAAAGYLRARWGEQFRLVVVEPEGAPCLWESVRQRRLVRVEGAPTKLGRLDCKEPSLVAYELLSRLADTFIQVSDDDCEAAALRLAKVGTSVSACGAAGLAGLRNVCMNDQYRTTLGLDEKSRVLLIGTETSAHSAKIASGMVAPNLQSKR